MCGGIYLWLVDTVIQLYGWKQLPKKQVSLVLHIYPVVILMRELLVLRMILEMAAYIIQR